MSWERVDHHNATLKSKRQRTVTGNSNLFVPWKVRSQRDIEEEKTALLPPPLPSLSQSRILNRTLSDYSRTVLDKAHERAVQLGKTASIRNDNSSLSPRTRERNATRADEFMNDSSVELIQRVEKSTILLPDIESSSAAAAPASAPHVRRVMHSASRLFADATTPDAFAESSTMHQKSYGLRYSRKNADSDEFQGALTPVCPTSAEDRFTTTLRASSQRRSESAPLVMSSSGFPSQQQQLDVSHLFREQQNRLHESKVALKRQHALDFERRIQERDAAEKALKQTIMDRRVDRSRAYLQKIADKQAEEARLLQRAQRKALGAFSESLREPSPSPIL